ncbi:hypothetical protein DLREEDagr8_25580 [Dongia sp. agr-C8]
MRKAIWPLAALIACTLYQTAGNAEDAVGGCSATPENAKYQLEKASGNSAQALQDWLHYCPNEDLMMKYAEEIQKAKAGTSGTSSSPTNPPATTPAPVPKSKSEPYGTFAQSGRRTFDDRSGYEDWDDTLIIRKDGTAELTTRYKVTYFEEWKLKGCEDGTKHGMEVIKSKFRVTVSTNTVSLVQQGKSERPRAEPSCWQYELKEPSGEPWVFSWSDGRLKDKDGEYFRQD